jgi:hypothetical protein
MFYQLAAAGSGAMVISSTGGTVNAVTTALGGYPAITINANGAFFNTGIGVGYAGQYAAQIGQIGPATQQAQDLILLHELAHYLQVPGFIPNDNTVPSQKSNNDAVFQNCNKTLYAGQS